MDLLAWAKNNPRGDRATGVISRYPFPQMEEFSMGSREECLDRYGALCDLCL